MYLWRLDILQALLMVSVLFLSYANEESISLFYGIIRVHMKNATSLWKVFQIKIW